MQKRIMVDMSATIIHHGHIRLLKKAKELGTVVVALTTDAEIETKKGYKPELSYENRKEIMESITYVDEVVPCNWLIEEDFLNKHRIDLLVHGDDNSNILPPERLIIFPRTEGVSSSDLRERVLDSLISLNLKNKNPMASDKLATLLIETIKKEFKMD
ncbi:MAG: adenylyltransferase/cytidyltransferase family protein [Desulfovibrionales bacterium]|nr:adenylyltransferase/cytidyltransferase family protein [Desulfovibrionales bacterium]